MPSVLGSGFRSVLAQFIRRGVEREGLRIEGSGLIVNVLVVLKCHSGGVWVCVIIPKNLQRPQNTPLLLRLELTQTVVEQ